MEFENNKIIKDFISSEESSQLIDWINSINHIPNCTIKHISEVRNKLNGNSYMFDVSKTENTKYITSYQSGNDVLNIDIPEIIYSIIDRISLSLNISKDNVFFQVINMNYGGFVKPHYDSSIDGFINYKCNISLLSDNYNFYVGNTTMYIEESDLYSFEASLYKHWSDEFLCKRIMISFGFLLPYNELNRSENDPRVRLSKRIKKYFQN